MPSFIPVIALSEATKQWENVPHFKSLNKKVVYKGVSYTIVKKEQQHVSTFGYRLLAIMTLGLALLSKDVRQICFKGRRTVHFAIPTKLIPFTMPLNSSVKPKSNEIKPLINKTVVSEAAPLSVTTKPHVSASEVSNKEFFDKVQNTVDEKIKGLAQKEMELAQLEALVLPSDEQIDNLIPNLQYDRALACKTKLIDWEYMVPTDSTREEVKKIFLATNAYNIGTIKMEIVAFEAQLQIAQTILKTRK